MLGCGTSSGVPRIGGDWGACDPADPRNRRMRASILVRTNTTTILVDTGPDMRAQLLAAEVGAPDAVIWTHEHADHCHGIDDLRQIYHLRGTPIPAYARPGTLALLRERFTYVFTGRAGYAPTVAGAALPDELTVGDIRIRVTDQPHGAICSAGLRFEHGGRAIGYATDLNEMTAAMRALYQELDIWVVDALRHRPHPTHPHIAEVLDWCRSLRPRRTVLTHMDQSLDYAALAATLPAGIEPGRDGLVIELA